MNRYIVQSAVYWNDVWMSGGYPVDSNVKKKPGKQHSRPIGRRSGMNASGMASCMT